jgi:hypothetical protein
MIKIDGYTILRDGSKIGWIDGIYIHAHDGTKLGYFEDKYVYNLDGNKIAYILGDYLHAEEGNNKIPLDKVSEQVTGGVISDIAKCAIYILF